MPSKPKSSRCEYSSHTISAILELHKSGQTHGEIAHHFKIRKSSITTILHRQARQPKPLFQPTKQTSCLPKLNARVQQAIIQHVKKFPYDNLNALSNSSKSGSTISQTTIKKCLKAEGYFCFKARRKLFLSDKYKAVRLK